MNIEFSKPRPIPERLITRDERGWIATHRPRWKRILNPILRRCCSLEVASVVRFEHARGGNAELLGYELRRCYGWPRRESV